MLVVFHFLFLFDVWLHSLPKIRSYRFSGCRFCSSIRFVFNNKFPLSFLVNEYDALYFFPFLNFKLFDDVHRSIPYTWERHQRKTYDVYLLQRIVDNFVENIGLKKPCIYSFTASVRVGLFILIVWPPSSCHYALIPKWLLFAFLVFVSHCLADSPFIAASILVPCELATM